MLSDSTIRRARDSDRDALVSIWERSVRATHHFLTGTDIEDLRPFAAKELRSGSIDLWILVNAKDVPLGFIGIVNDRIEALFLDPVAHGKGGGRRLVAHAQSLSGGALAVDVNEQNEAARAFYESLGFTATGRSDLDGAGRPFPLLHLRRPPPSDFHFQERT
ncbi:MAG TPA: acetyltransferase [Gemmatimonadaceae bacterium]|nr:acetyltransferase [Gemmatimonadaceae bacterium]